MMKVKIQSGLHIQTPKIELVKKVGMVLNFNHYFVNLQLIKVKPTLHRSHIIIIYNNFY